MKTKIFSLVTSEDNPDFSSLENGINEWLNSNLNVEVLDTKITSCTGTDRFGLKFINCTVLIFFK